MAITTMIGSRTVRIVPPKPPTIKKKNRNIHHPLFFEFLIILPLKSPKL
jgi:hypothetical protein